MVLSSKRMSMGIVEIETKSLPKYFGRQTNTSLATLAYMSGIFAVN